MIAHASGFSVDQVDKWLKTFSQARDGAIAMHLPSFPGSPVTISETIPDQSAISPDKALEAMQEGDFLREIMQKHLKPMEIRVLSYRFGMNGTGPLTLRDTGARIQRSGERARLIQRKAMAKLRRALTFMKK